MNSSKIYLNYFVFPEYCSLSHLEDGISSIAECRYKGRKVKCNNEILPGTIAHIECAYGFVEPNGRHFVDQLTCGENGQWDAYKQACEMQCGQLVGDDVTPFSTRGETVHITKTPWHVAIYFVVDDVVPDHRYFCGGTIISPFLVLSGECKYRSS